MELPPPLQKYSCPVFVMQEDEDAVVMAAIAALDNVYSHFAAQGDLTWMPRPPKVEDRSHDDVLYEYSCWRREVCGSCRDQLLCLLLHPQHSVAVRRQSLSPSHLTSLHPCIPECCIGPAPEDGGLGRPRLSSRHILVPQFPVPFRGEEAAGERQRWRGSDWSLCGDVAGPS